MVEGKKLISEIFKRNLIKFTFDNFLTLDSTKNREFDLKPME